MPSEATTPVVGERLTKARLTFAEDGGLPDTEIDSVAMDRIARIRIKGTGPLTPADLDGLEALIADTRATRGPNDEPWFTPEYLAELVGPEDAAFIAAANPESILALIALARRAVPGGGDWPEREKDLAWLERQRADERVLMKLVVDAGTDRILAAIKSPE